MTNRNRIIAATLAAAIALPLMATAASRVRGSTPEREDRDDD